MLRTPYYSTDIPDDYDGPIPNTNYKIQDLFCLSTRMYPEIRKLLGPEIKISYDTSDEPEFNDNGKHIMFMVLTRGGKSVTDLSDSDIKFLENSIDKYTSDPEKLCLVFSADAIIFDNRGRKISNIWIRSMLGYIDPPEEYLSRLNDTGILIHIPENTAPETGYEQFQETYHKLVLEITETIQNMYNSGYMITTPGRAEKWELQLVPDTEELYRPMWIVHKMTGDDGVNTFLNRALRGRFQILVGYNKVIRHYIASRLSDYRFEANYLIARVKNIEETRHIASLVHMAINTSDGRILTFKRTRSVWMKLYSQAATELFPESSIVTYLADDQQVFSCLRPLDKPLVDEQLELKRRAQLIFKKLTQEHGKAYFALDHLNTKHKNS